jgi:hypothetical protein
VLLPMRPGLAASLLFTGLNALLLEVVRSRSTGTPFDGAVLPAGLWAAIHDNNKTQRLLEQLNAAIDELSAPERAELLAAVERAQTIRPLFCDRALNAPEIPAALRDPLWAFTSNLFSHTAKLVGVTAACGEAVMDHYQRYAADAPPGNGNVCGMCGTEYLAQRRTGIGAAEQWRAPYDHLLAEAKYPLFAVHPENLLPVCRSCNEKAKLAKDLLFDDDGHRRVCFDPWSEDAHDQVNLIGEFQDLLPRVSMTMTGPSRDHQDKLITWNAVYRIKERVEGEFLSLREKLAEDLNIQDLEAFKKSLADKAGARSEAARLTPGNFWRGLLYRSLLSLPDDLLEQLRSFSEAGVDPDGDAAAVFGI